jgi:DNA-binding transcriptional ArsR family regulator
MPSVDALSTTFSALADPTRRAILARLALGEASVGELAEPFDISLPAVSRHLKVLESARLIVREKDAQWRRCRLEAGPLKLAADWVEQYRDFWEERFDALDALLKQQTTETQEANNGTKRRRGKRRTRRR